MLAVESIVRQSQTALSKGTLLERGLTEADRPPTLGSECTVADNGCDNNDKERIIKTGRKFSQNHVQNYDSVSPGCTCTKLERFFYI